MTYGGDGVANSRDGFRDNMHRSSEVRRDDNVVVDGKNVVEVENCSCFCTDELGDVFVADGKPDVIDTGEHGLGSDRGFHVSGWERRVAVIDDEDLPGFEMDESCEEDCFEYFDVGVVTGDDEGGAAGEGGVGEGVHVDADVGGVGLGRLEGSGGLDCFLFVFDLVAGSAVGGEEFFAFLFVDDSISRLGRSSGAKSSTSRSSDNTKIRSSSRISTCRPSQHHLMRRITGPTGDLFLQLRTNVVEVDRLVQDDSTSPVLWVEPGCSGHRWSVV